MRPPWMAIGFLALLSCTHRPPGPAAATARSLFNGKDLSGWHTYLGIPGKTVEGVAVPRNADGTYTGPVGLNVDPKKVFTVATVDGAPAIRISGEIWGGIVTVEEHGDMHLSLAYKWGDRRWPPREHHVPDSGILYLSVGPHGVANSEKAWMESLECQIQQGDTGDFWSVAKMHADVTAEPFVDSENRKVLRYLPGGAKYVRWEPGSLSRVVKRGDFEVPGWNRVDVWIVKGQIVHVVNGQVVNRLWNPRRTVDGRVVPVTRGKIQLQSEGAEVFYRDITVAPATELPAALAAAPPQ